MWRVSGLIHSIISSRDNRVLSHQPFDRPARRALRAQTADRVFQRLPAARRRTTSTLHRPAVLQRAYPRS